LKFKKRINRERKKMAFDVDKELKIYVYIGIIVLIIFGLWLFISAESYHAIMGGGPYFNPVTYRYLGGVYIAWAIAIIPLLKKLDNWEIIQNWMILAVIANALGVIACIIGLIMYNFAIGSLIISIILNLFFTIVGIHIYIQKRK